MKKFGFGEILTLTLVILGGIFVIAHPTYWQEACTSLACGIVLISFFIGYE